MMRLSEIGFPDYLLICILHLYNKNGVFLFSPLATAEYHVLYLSQSQYFIIHIRFWLMMWIMPLPWSWCH